MSFEIHDGIPESELINWLKSAAEKFGTFADGRVNYSNADIAPIVMCTVICSQKILLVKRGFGLADAEGYWSTINGFIDEIKPIKDQAKQEISEELGLKITDDQILTRPSYTLSNPAEKRKYIVFACLVSLSSRPEIVLNEENTRFAWISREQLAGYDTLDDLAYSIDSAIGK